MFTSVELAKSLKSKKTTVVGTVNKIRRDVPKVIKTMKLPLYSTRIFTNEELTVTFHQVKPLEHVLVLSSVHEAVPISDNPRNSLKVSCSTIALNLGLIILIRWLVRTLRRWLLDDGPCRFATIY